MTDRTFTRLKVVVARTTELSKPAKVVFHPTEEMECLEIDGAYYLPTIQWLKYEGPEKPKQFANMKWSPENSGAWVALEGEEEAAVEKEDGVGDEDTFFAEGRPDE